MLLDVKPMLGWMGKGPYFRFRLGDQRMPEYEELEGHDSASKMLDAPAPSAPDPADKGWGPWKLDRLSVRTAENGGVVVDCSKSRKRTAPEPRQGNGAVNTMGDSYENKDYVFTTIPEALQFIAQELGSSGPAQPSAVDAPVPIGAPVGEGSMG